MTPNPMRPRQARKLTAPSQVARRSGAAEKLAMLSQASATIRGSGYFVSPAARTSRS